MFGIKYFGIRVLPGNILNFIGICVFFMPTFMNLGLSLHLTGMAWHLSILFFERAISLIHYIAISVFIPSFPALISMSCFLLHWGLAPGLSETLRHIIWSLILPSFWFSNVSIHSSGISS